MLVKFVRFFVDLEGLILRSLIHLVLIDCTIMIVGETLLVHYYQKSFGVPSQVRGVSRRVAMTIQTQTLSVPVMLVAKSEIWVQFHELFQLLQKAWLFYRRK